MYLRKVSPAIDLKPEKITSRTQILTTKKSLKLKNSMVTRIIDGDEIKNTAGQVLTHNSKNFHRLNNKEEIECTITWFGKPFRKTFPQKIEKKTVKSKPKMPHVNKKPQKFCSYTVFSLNCKIRLKMSGRKRTRFFAPLPVSAWPKSRLQFDFKIMKMCEQIFKKDSAPIEFKCKNHNAPIKKITSKISIFT